MGSGVVDHSFGAILDQEFKKLQTLYKTRKGQSNRAII